MLHKDRSRLRDECLSTRWFLPLEDAKAKIDAWWADFNESRPHSSLWFLTPADEPPDLSLWPEVFSRQGQKQEGHKMTALLSSRKRHSTIQQRHIVRTYLEDIGVNTTNSSTMNAAALSAATKSGNVTLNVRPGNIYNMGHVPITASNVRIVCEGSNKPTLYMPAATFNNNMLKSYNSNALLLNVHGNLSGSFEPVSNILVENLIIQSEILDGRYLRGVAARNVNNFNMNGVEIFGFPAGIGITLGTVNGDSGIRGCYIHDFYTDNPWSSTDAQTTGIEIDNDRYNGLASEGLKIISPRIDNLVFGANAIAAVNDQTDGINICHHSSRFHTISDARISRVAEGIDQFGSDCIFNNPVISQVRYAGLKIFHGASRNIYYSPIIKDAVQFFVAIGGSYVVGVPDTKSNIVKGGAMTGLNYTTTATGTTAGVFITDNRVPKLVSRPKWNTFQGTLIDEGMHGPRAWYDESTFGYNVGEALNIICGARNVKRVSIPFGGGRVSLAGAASNYYTDLT